MSSRGPAASTLSGTSHAFFGPGNGGFQQNNYNWGESILDFTLSSGGMGTTPAKSFTPYGGVALSPPLGTSNCPNEGSGDCQTTAEVLNLNDWDMATSGILLFTDSSSNNWLVTMDKAGYGYLLRQAQSWSYAFALGDSYNWFPFGAAQTLCPSLPNPAAADCHRTTSLAYFNPSGGTPYLYFWPWKEQLSAYQFSNNSAQTGSGTISASGGTTVTGTGTSFLSTFVPGDMLIAGGCTPSTPGSCPIVTAIASDSSLTINQNLTASGSYSYRGYFINPIYDQHPPANAVGYPGGLLAGTSNGSSSSSAVIWALVAKEVSGSYTSNEAVRTPGVLFAYDTGLNLQWYSSDGFCSSSFALPTAVDGKVFVPTYAIGSGSNVCPTSGSPVTSGVLVYAPTP